MTGDAQDPVRRVGFDVTGLAVVDLKRAGITLAPSQHPIPKTNRRWLSHSEVATRYPRRDEYDRVLARTAAAAFAAKHDGSVQGLRLARSFPCLGHYRVENDAAETGPKVVVCDTCGDRFGVRRDEFDAAFGAPPLS